MDSDFSYDVEMKRTLEQHEAHQARIIPVILRPVANRAVATRTGNRDANG